MGNVPQGKSFTFFSHGIAIVKLFMPEKGAIQVLVSVGATLQNFSPVQKYTGNT